MSAFGQQLTHVPFHTILSYQDSAACMWLNQWTLSSPLLFNLPEGMCVITDPITLLLPTPQCFPSSQLMFKCFTMDNRTSLVCGLSQPPSLTCHHSLSLTMLQLPWPSLISQSSKCPPSQGLSTCRSHCLGYPYTHPPSSPDWLLPTFGS